MTIVKLEQDKVLRTIPGLKAKLEELKEFKRKVMEQLNSEKVSQEI